MPESSRWLSPDWGRLRDRYLADHPHDMIGTRFKVVTGYLGSQETILAIERGEADGRCL